MVAQRAGNRTSQITRQRTLFAPELPSPAKVSGPDVPCDIAPIEKRRDGGTRYWCRAHRADATAKGGKPAKKCRAADRIPLRDDEIKVLDLDKYRGEVDVQFSAAAAGTPRTAYESALRMRAAELGALLKQNKLAEFRALVKKYQGYP